MLARLALGLALACTACASNATQSSRDAWSDALTRGTKPGGAGGRGGGLRGRGSLSQDPWSALSRFTGESVQLLADGSSTVTLARLAERLCKETPPELADDPDVGAVRCEPREPVDPLGHALEVELGRASTIGFVALDLSDTESEQLVRQALKRIGGACMEVWKPAPRRADNALEEFHTCPAAGGAELVLGRFPSPTTAGRWQFSLAVLGPG